jgi:hypothetical protein
MDCMASVQQIIRSGTSAHALAAQSEEDFEAQTDALLAAADIGIRPEDLNAADGGGHGADDLAALLGQLRTEPGSDEERAAKFQLYETFAETVSDARQATLDFWDEAAEEFGEAGSGARRGVERDISKLDSHQNLGFAFGDGGDHAAAPVNWFVHDMAVCAHRNADAIERLLQSMRMKLELLGSQAECPVCLEPFHEGGEEGGEGAGAGAAGGDGSSSGSGLVHRPATTLSCCHKVCTSCWEHWKRINPHNAFCPLCREQDFLVQIMSGN